MGKGVGRGLHGGGASQRATRQWRRDETEGAKTRSFLSRVPKHRLPERREYCRLLHARGLRDFRDFRDHRGGLRLRAKNIASSAAGGAPQRLNRNCSNN